MIISQSKTPTVAEQHGRMRAAEIAVRNAAGANGWKVPASLRDSLRSRVEECSGGRNTVLYTAEGVPGIYVRIPASSSVFPSAMRTELSLTDRLHEAFIVGGSAKDAIHVAKYPAAAVDHDTGVQAYQPSGTNANIRMASLPGLDPCSNINFDEALAYCGQNGSGFHLMSNAEWAYIYLLTLAWSWEPRGANNNAGADYVRTDEQSDFLDISSSNRRSLTGSGPVSWGHDGSPYGVWDLNGNVWEFVSGLRWLDAEVQAIPDNNAAAGADHAVSSTAWKAILTTDGSYVNPGTALGLNIRIDGSTPVLADAPYVGSDASYNTQFSALTADMTVAPRIKRLGLAPLSFAAPQRGRFYVNPDGERLPRRGGYWSSTSHAGVAALRGSASRSSRIGYYGCRPAFVY